MMMSEFVERTGFQLTHNEYAKIEADYYKFNGDKDAFCRSFVERNMAQDFYDARARYIAGLESQLMEEDKAHKAELDDIRAKMEQIQKELDHELEWKHCEGTGTNMNQERYEELKEAGRTMTAQEAVAFIEDECGFKADKIKILHEVSTYEINKYRRIRKAESYVRPPVYNSTDWNYVRFDCGSFMYELVNGELRFYCM